MDIGRNIWDETDGKLIATANHTMGTRQNTKGKTAQRKMDGKDGVLSKHGLTEEYKLTEESDMCETWFRAKETHCTPEKYCIIIYLLRSFIYTVVFLFLLCVLFALFASCSFFVFLLACLYSFGVAFGFLCWSYNWQLYCSASTLSNWPELILLLSPPPTLLLLLLTLWLPGWHLSTHKCLSHTKIWAYFTVFHHTTFQVKNYGGSQSTGEEKKMFGRFFVKSSL